MILTHCDVVARLERFSLTFFLKTHFYRGSGTFSKETIANWVVNPNLGRFLDFALDHPVNNNNGPVKSILTSEPKTMRRGEKRSV